jgi:hypothetical protein
MFAAELQPKPTLRRFLVEVSRLHTDIHLVRLLSTSGQPVPEAATCTTHIKHKRRIYMPYRDWNLHTP